MMPNVNECQSCSGSGTCSSCSADAGFGLRSVLRNFCQGCLGTRECPKCEGLGAMSQLTTVGAWRQAVVQDGLIL